MTGHPETHLLGIRLRDSARLRYAAADSGEIAVGSWVIVAVDRGEEPAQVVVTSDQMTAVEMPETPVPVLRVLDDDEIQRTTPACDGAPSEVSEGTRLVGGVGHFDPARQGISHEDQRYRQLKAQLPRLGQRLTTARGSATVVALDVFKATLTVRYDGNGQEESLGVADVPGRDGMQEEG